MYFGVSFTILAAEYTVGLKMIEKVGESSVHVLSCFSYDSGRRVHSNAENDRNKLARVPSMYFAAFPMILAAEYTAGLKMIGTNWREFRPCTCLLFLQFWPQSTQQD